VVRRAGADQPHSAGRSHGDGYFREAYKLLCGPENRPVLAHLPHPHSFAMRSRIAVLALASTALAAPAYRPSCSYSCPTRDARGGQLIAGIEFFGQLQCSYLTGMCTYSTVSLTVV
jgi:hypothetical protein